MRILIDFKLLINRIKGYDVFWKMKIFKGGYVGNVLTLDSDSSTIHEFIERVEIVVDQNLSIFELVWIFESKNEFLKGGRGEGWKCSILWIINANSLDRQTRIFIERKLWLIKTSFWISKWEWKNIFELGSNEFLKGVEMLSLLWIINSEFLDQSMNLLKGWRLWLIKICQHFKLGIDILSTIELLKFSFQKFG